MVNLLQRIGAGGDNPAAIGRLNPLSPYLLGARGLGDLVGQAQALLAAQAAAGAAGTPADIASIIAATPGGYGSIIPLLISRFGPAWTQNLLNVITTRTAPAGKVPVAPVPTPVAPVRPIPSDIPPNYPYTPPVITPSSGGQPFVPLGGQYPQRRTPSEIPPNYPNVPATPTPTGGALAGRLPPVMDTGQAARLRRILGLTSATQGVRAGMR